MNIAVSNQISRIEPESLHLRAKGAEEEEGWEIAHWTLPVTLPGQLLQGKYGGNAVNNILAFEKVHVNHKILEEQLLKFKESRMTLFAGMQ